jgi:BirA family biotin operon repressor/biotin-[acetyl-CoA-carboxylase] ligase
MDVINKRRQRLKRALAGRRLGQPLFWFATVGSTNDVLKEKAQAGGPEGCTVIADRQTRGRGRRGKHWHSRKGKGVYLSLLLRPGWPAGEASLISMLAVVGVARGLEALGVRQIRVKWPNDVLAGGKKIAGILVEPRVSRHLIDFAVVGIGINIGHTRSDLDFPGAAAATSCRLEGVALDCEQVIIQVLKELDACYDLVRQNRKDQLLEEWARRRAEQVPSARHRGTNMDGADI